MALMHYLFEHNRWMSIMGIVGMIALSYSLSRNRKLIDWTLTLKTLILQFLIAVVFLRFAWGQAFVQSIARVVCTLNDYAQEGATFVFGNLVDAQQGWGFIFAVKVLPVTLFLSALTSLLLHFGIIQRITKVATRFFAPFLGLSSAESAVAIANSFLSQTEAPLLIRHQLRHMTRSELFVVMLSGMATISSAILVVYAAMGIPALHLITCSIMSIPGSIMIAKIIMPEHEVRDESSEKLASSHTSSNMFDALATGTSEGLMMALHIGAFLISFIALLACANGVLGFLSGLYNSVVPLQYQIPSLSVALIGSYLFAPIGYLLGFTGSQALIAGELVSLKVMVNELIAYTGMASLTMDDRMKAIITYALCGFSNFSCIGIQLGALGVLAPEKKQTVAQLGVYAVVGAAVSNCISAMIANLILS